MTFIEDIQAETISELYGRDTSESTLYSRPIAAIAAIAVVLLITTAMIVYRVRNRSKQLHKSNSTLATDAAIKVTKFSSTGDVQASPSPSIPMPRRISYIPEHNLRVNKRTLSQRQLIQIKAAHDTNLSHLHGTHGSKDRSYGSDNVSNDLQEYVNDSLDEQLSSTASSSVMSLTSSGHNISQVESESAKEVFAAWLPHRFDELSLSPGDKVIVFTYHEDGWCEGMILGTNERGFFPAECLDPASQSPVASKTESISTEPVKK